ncbi:MFS transporter [Pseudomonas chlororaphis]|uniref:MFS transporter n=1 Tax=Pseudomonas chlororaphis TaxID=587753 RepID=UPI000F588F92|nr:MFS transporter [Pseudomonas chlororaphis]
MQHALLSRPILSLTLSSFAIGLSEFVTIGLMSPISESLSIGLPETGLLITLYAMGVSIGAPSIAYCTRHFSSKTVCLWLIALFAFANLLSAVTYTFPLLLLTRIGAGAAHGAFFSVASNLAPALVIRDKAPLAIAVMFSGLTLGGCR